MNHQAELFPASAYCERWTDRRPMWRHTSEGGFDARRFEVGPLDESTAKAFVCRHHYSGTYPAAVQRYGLWQAGQLQGVAVLSVPISRGVLTGPFPELEPFSESLELGRFVLLDEVPANGESWFLAQVFHQAAALGLRGVVSFSDPVARSSADGRLIFPGHVGTIYQASNAIYAGRGTARSLLILPDGKVFSERALSKLRGGERGKDYASAQLAAYGITGYSAEALAAGGVRRLRHPGNHRYLFTLGRFRGRVQVATPSYPYPKRLGALRASTGL